MKITRDVINDLLPLYLAGEVSADSRLLVDEFLREHPDVARVVREQAVRAASALNEMVPGPPPDLEKQTFERTRRFNRYRTRLLAFCILWTLMPFTLLFEGGQVRWIMVRDNPRQAVFFWIAALVCWGAYYLMGRRLRSV